MRGSTKRSIYDFFEHLFFGAAVTYGIYVVFAFLIVSFPVPFAFAAFASFWLWQSEFRERQARLWDEHVFGFKNLWRAWKETFATKQIIDWLPQSVVYFTTAYFWSTLNG